MNYSAARVFLCLHLYGHRVGVCPSETGLSVDRVFRVEPISLRHGGLWALCAEPQFSSSAFPSHSFYHHA